MKRAKVFPGAVEFIRRAVGEGHQVWILSHRSRLPAMGPRYDLWGAAMSWLEKAGFLRPGGPLRHRDIFLAPTREIKIRTMMRLGCTDFIDDLPEVLGHPLFPRSVRAHLFDPLHQHGAGAWLRASRWQTLRERILR